MELITFVFYGVGLMIIGFFSGLGQVFGKWYFENYLQHKIKNVVETRKESFVNIKNGLKKLGDEFG